MLLSSWEEAEHDDFFKEDVERIKSLPNEAMQLLRQHVQQVMAGNTPKDRACIWLDRQSMKCKFHEYRPSICRDFEKGSYECREWRNEFNIK
jgi:Fe-S-cluster containining protein